MRKFILQLMFILAISATGAFADSVYLKDGSIVRGRIVQEDGTAVMVDKGDSWQKIERSAIEHIEKGDAGPAGAIVGAPMPHQDSEARQRADRTGFYLGVQVPYNMIDGDFDGTKASRVSGGAGLGIILGLRLDPHVGLEIDWSGTAHTSGGADVGLGEFSLNAKVSFLPEDDARPFLFAGVGSFALGSKDLMYGGTGYNLGVGLDFSVSPRNTLGIAVIQKFITYDEILEGSPPSTFGELNGDTTSIRFDFTHQF